MEVYVLKTISLGNLLKLILVLGLLGNFTSTVSAQDYYPADVGNEWVLLHTDGGNRRIYSLEDPEDDADRDLILLKIVTEKIDTGKISGIDQYFVTSDNEGIKLHKTDLKLTTSLLPDPVNIIANFPTPVIFFPKVLTLGKKWKIEADTKIIGIDVKSNNEFEIVAFEDVVTPTATFYNCAKIQLKVSITSSLLTLAPTTSYQWLAPNIGPVKYETSNRDIFEIISFKRSPPPVVRAQNPPMWNLPSNTFQVIGTRLGGILNAKILGNVEDYVSEVGNLGILAVTGEIVPPGNGTGFATNLQRKQDLWVAGNFENAPIIGTITLFAENNKGRTTVTINVTINDN